MIFGNVELVYYEIMTEKVTHMLTCRWTRVHQTHAKVTKLSLVREYVVSIGVPVLMLLHVSTLKFCFSLLDSLYNFPAGNSIRLSLKNTLF